MPGLAKQSILDVVKSSCKSVSNDAVKVNEDAAQALAQSLNPDAVKASIRTHMFPVKFDDLKSEVTLLALYNMLDFGSGYDKILLQRIRRDAHETVQFAVIGVHISGTRIDYHWMKAFNPYSVHNLFGIESRDDAEVMPGVTMSRPGVLHPLAQSIVSSVQETGALLEDSGHRTLGDFILSVLDEMKQKGKLPSASVLVESVAETFPAFSDEGLYEGRPITFLRKAQNLVSDLYFRFKGEDDRFNFVDADMLTADSGNVLPAILRNKGVLEYGQELSSIVDEEQDLSAGAHERAIRAATITAIDSMVEAAGNSFNARELSAYLLASLEEMPEDQVVAMKKHLVKGTVAY